jgi:hypothetical protein
MIGSGLASIGVNLFNYRPWLRETLGPNERLLEATIILKRDKKRCRIVALSSVDRISCGDERLREPECAS